MATKSKRIIGKIITPKRETKTFTFMITDLGPPVAPKGSVLIAPNETLEKSVEILQRNLGGLARGWLHGDNSFVITIETWLVRFKKESQKRAKVMSQPNKPLSPKKLEPSKPQPMK